MKKILLGLLILIGVGLLTLGIFIYLRFQKNLTQIVPYPYIFSYTPENKPLEAPIVIIGDRMALYMGKFKNELIDTISKDLSNKIKIETLAHENYGVHRTLYELKSLNEWPKILIYAGASEEFYEDKFDPTETKKVKNNFKLYSDERIQTALLFYPELSRIIYNPIKFLTLTNAPQPSSNKSHEEYLKNLDTEILLFEQNLIELIQRAKEKNALLILTTTPINLDIRPKKSCSFTAPIELEKDILDIDEFIKNNDFKSAYNLSQKLKSTYSGNAELFYLHGKSLERLGEIDRARNSLKEASAFDCVPWRATELHNSIIRKVAKNHQVILFDFAKLVENDWPGQITFVDEIYPQNIYYEYAMKQLGLVIKGILKL